MPNKLLLHGIGCGLYLTVPGVPKDRNNAEVLARIPPEELRARMLEAWPVADEGRGPFVWVHLDRGEPIRDLCRVAIPAWDDYLWFGPDRIWFESLGLIVARGGHRTAMCRSCSRYCSEDATRCMNCGAFDADDSMASDYGCSVSVDHSSPMYQMFGGNHATSHG